MEFDYLILPLPTKLRAFNVKKPSGFQSGLYTSQSLTPWKCVLNSAAALDTFGKVTGTTRELPAGLYEQRSDRGKRNGTRAIQQAPDLRNVHSRLRSRHRSRRHPARSRCIIAISYCGDTCSRRNRLPVACETSSCPGAAHLALVYRWIVPVGHCSRC